MELIIGRESGNQRLQITADNGNVGYYGVAGSVPKSVSRQHCKLQILNDQDLIVINIKPENKTFVNGLAVNKKHIGYNDLVELGKDKYMLSLSAIVNAFKGGVPGGNGGKTTQTYSIAHLEKVWNDYNKEKKDFQKRIGRINAVSTITYPIILVGGLLSTIESIRYISLFITVIVIIFSIYMTYFRYKLASEQLDIMDKIDKKLHDNYVCPNPDCGKFLGYQPYDDLKKTKKCYQCQSEYRAD